MRVRRLRRTIQARSPSAEEGAGAPVSRQDVVITVKGEMDEPLRGEFEDVDLSVDHGVTRLRVVAADSSLLHGVLHRIDALGLELLDVHHVDPGSPGRR